MVRHDHKFMLTTVHPRLCGEHHSRHQDRLAIDGSSPPVRGTLRLRLLSLPQNRFIPACAGNIRRSRCMPNTATVHPRLCGEHVLGVVVFVDYPGSSPPVRGTLNNSFWIGVVWRFIPACAGNISSPPYSGSKTPVHPRLCGEHCHLYYKLVPFYGSSPPVRGTWNDSSIEVGTSRFIPACAGNITNARVIVDVGSVHPRLCGEHIRTETPHRADVGSSPPVRGTSRIRAFPRSAFGSSPPVRGT